MTERNQSFFTKQMNLEGPGGPRSLEARGVWGLSNPGGLEIQIVLEVQEPKKSMGPRDPENLRGQECLGSPGHRYE